MTDNEDGPVLEFGKADPANTILGRLDQSGNFTLGPLLARAIEDKIDMAVDISYQQLVDGIDELGASDAQMQKRSGKLGRALRVLTKSLKKLRRLVRRNWKEINGLNEVFTSRLLKLENSTRMMSDVILNAEQVYAIEQRLSRIEDRNAAQDRQYGAGADAFVTYKAGVDARLDALRIRVEKCERGVNTRKPSLREQHAVLAKSVMALESDESLAELEKRVMELEDSATIHENAEAVAADDFSKRLQQLEDGAAVVDRFVKGQANLVEDLAKDVDELKANSVEVDASIIVHVSELQKALGRSSKNGHRLLALEEAMGDVRSGLDEHAKGIENVLGRAKDNHNHIMSMKVDLREEFVQLVKSADASVKEGHQKGLTDLQELIRQEAELRKKETVELSHRIEQLEGTRGRQQALIIECENKVDTHEKALASLDQSLTQQIALTQADHELLGKLNASMKMIDWGKHCKELNGQTMAAYVRQHYGWIHELQNAVRGLKDRVVGVVYESQIEEMTARANEELSAGTRGIVERLDALGERFSGFAMEMDKKIELRLKGVVSPNWGKSVVVESVELNQSVDVQDVDLPVEQALANILGLELVDDVRGNVEEVGVNSRVRALSLPGNATWYASDRTKSVDSHLLLGLMLQKCWGHKLFWERYHNDVGVEMYRCGDRSGSSMDRDPIRAWVLRFNGCRLGSES